MASPRDLRCLRSAPSVRKPRHSAPSPPATTLVIRRVLDAPISGHGAPGPLTIRPLRMTQWRRNRVE